MERLPQLPGGEGIHRTGEGLFRRHLKQVLDRQIPAGIMTARFLGTDIFSFIVFLRRAHIVAVFAGHMLIDIAFRWSKACIREVAVCLIHTELDTEPGEALYIICQLVFDGCGQRIGSHLVFQLKFRGRHQTVGRQHALKFIAVFPLFAGEDMGSAGI